MHLQTNKCLYTKQASPWCSGLSMESEEKAGQQLVWWYVKND